VTTPVVMDASVLVRWSLSPVVQTRVEACCGSAPWHAPDIVLVECANALWKHGAFGTMPHDDVREALDVIGSADIDLHEAAPLLPAALEIAIALGHPVYDCLYVALVMAEDAELVTCDRRLAQTARDAGLGDRVTLIEG
jgi:predicted nucleic acid-binding protein